MQYKAVLFDLDGTLANTIADLAAALNFALRQSGLPELGTEHVKQLVGSGWNNLILGALGDKGDDPALVKEVGAAFIQYYDAHFMDETVLYPGILPLLDRLEAAGMKLGVVTNKRRYMAVLVLRKLFGRDRIATVLGPEEGVPTKPDPHMPLAAMKELGVHPEETLFVGDSGVDMLTAANCGAVGVGVLWGFRDERELREAGASHIIAKPEELLALLALS